MATGDTDIFSRMRLSPHTLPAINTSDILEGVELALGTAAPLPQEPQLVSLCVRLQNTEYYMHICSCVCMYVNECHDAFISFKT